MMKMWKTLLLWRADMPVMQRKDAKQDVCRWITRESLPDND